MSAVDEIEAAIAKLTTLRDESTSGPWIVEPTNYCGEVAAHLNITDAGTDTMDDIVPPFDLIADAELIVTLHATIAAQLAILRDDYDTCVKNKWIPDRRALALARAINGVTS